METATITRTTTAFEVGATYSTRSIGDHNCIWTFEVIARTARFVTLRSPSFRNGSDATDTARVGIRTYRDTEVCSPFGSYSMAPVLMADRPAA